MLKALADGSAVKQLQAEVTVKNEQIEDLKKQVRTLKRENKELKRDFKI